MLTDQEREQASKIQAQMRAELAKAGANRDLNRQASNRIRAQAVLRARAELAELRQASDERHAGQLAKAYRDAFGITIERSGEDRAYRDKLVADAPTAAQGKKMMANAIAIGDLIAARALAQYAWERRHEIGGQWIEVLNTYGQASAANDRAISNLIIAEPDKRDLLSDKLHTQVMTPSDLPPNLEALAAEPDQSASQRAMGARFG